MSALQTWSKVGIPIFSGVGLSPRRGHVLSPFGGLLALEDAASTERFLSDRSIERLGYYCPHLEVR